MKKALQQLDLRSLVNEGVLLGIALTTIATLANQTPGF